MTLCCQTSRLTNHTITVTERASSQPHKHQSHTAKSRVYIHMYVCDEETTLQFRLKKIPNSAFQAPACAGLRLEKESASVLWLYRGKTETGVLENGCTGTALRHNRRQAKSPVPGLTHIRGMEVLEKNQQNVSGIPFVWHEPFVYTALNLVN